MRKFSLTSSQLDWLKIAAILFMVVDHINNIWWHRDVYAMTVIGRLSFPLFCLIAAWNYEYHSKDKWAYIKRMMIFGIISQPFYMYATGYQQLNIFFTLGGGLLAIWLYDQRQRWPEITWPLMMLGLWVFGTMVDYWQPGFILIPLLVIWLRYRNPWMAGLIAVDTLACNFFLPYAPMGLGAYLIAYGSMYIMMQAPRLPRYFYYAFYPAHLLVLKLIALAYFPS